MTSYTRPMRPSYPTTRRVDQHDDYHGTSVADPYRWLEDPEAEDVQAWVAAQAELAADYLERLPSRAALRDRMAELWDTPRWSVPRHRAGVYVYHRNDGLADQPTYYRTRDLRAAPEVLLDPNALSDDGAVAIVDLFMDRDAQRMAYTVAEAGSDMMTMRVLDLATGEATGDVIDGVRFANAAWLPDGSGFFYPKYPAATEELAPNTNQRVWFHRLGTDQSADELVYERPDEPHQGFAPFVTEDGRFLCLMGWEGTASETRLFVKALQGDPVVGEADAHGFVRVLDEFDAAYEFVHNAGTTFYLRTDRDAPRGMVGTLDVATGAWRTLVPEAEDTLEFVQASGGHLVLGYLQDAYHRLVVHDAGGTRVREIPLPAIGSVAALSGRMSDPDLFIDFQSHLDPPTVLRHEMATGQTEQLWSAPPRFDRDDFETRQVFITADDGVALPIFVTHRRGLTGPAPTILYGYGGFDIAITPTYSPARIAFLEAGGVFASAVLRGGSEYGQAWHRAGMLGNKQRVFDDFIQCAEGLIAEGITASEQLGIYGGSNGGLLTAACLLQRPDLFGAVGSAVPVTDMLRFHRFTAGVYWTPEYGNAEEQEDHFRFLLAYSPLHNVDPAGSYPPVLITTAESDDRVVPSHAYKFGAALQSIETNESPVVLRIERRAGHGLGKPTSKLIDEAADLYAFFLYHLRSEGDAQPNVR